MKKYGNLTLKLEPNIASYNEKTKLVTSQHVTYQHTHKSDALHPVTALSLPLLVRIRGHKGQNSAETRCRGF